MYFFKIKTLTIINTFNNFYNLIINKINNIDFPKLNVFFVHQILNLLFKKIFWFLLSVYLNF